MTTFKCLSLVLLLSFATTGSAQVPKIETIDLTTMPAQGTLDEKVFSGTPDADGVLKNYQLNIGPFSRGSYFVTSSERQWPDGTNKVTGEAFGTSFGEQAPGGMFLIAQGENGDYIAVVPIAGERSMSWLEVADNRLLLKLGTLGDASISGDFPLIAWAKADDVYDACRRAWAAALGSDLVTGGTGFREDKVYPELFEYLGWCTWEEYRGDIDAQLLVQAARAIEDCDIPIRYYLIDNGHPGADDERRMLSFGPNEKFPDGWSELLSMRSPDKLRWIGIWFSFNGCKTGLSPDNDFGPRMNEHLMPVDAKGTLYPKEDADSSQAFYDAFIESIQANDFDFVKIDHQASNLSRYVGCENAVAAATQNSRALEEAVHARMQTMINCMALNSVCAFNTRYSAVTRCSRDYGVGDAKKGKYHLHQSYINTLWMGQTVWPDHDMFHSCDPAAGRMMAVSKAMSGAPIYLSDAPEDFIAEYIRPLCYEDGLLLRPLAPAAPLPESIFSDPMSDPIPYRVMAPLAGGAMAIVAYHLTEPTAEEVVAASVRPEDYASAGGMIQPYPGPWQIPREGLVVYDWSLGAAEKLEEEYSFTIEGFNDRLLHLCPIRDGWAVIGRTDKYLSPVAVEVLSSSPSELKIRMVESGPLSVWCDRGTPNVAGASVEACGGGLFHVPMPTGNRDQIVTITR
jgi:hypothetical protein